MKCLQLKEMFQLFSIPVLVLMLLNFTGCEERGRLSFGCNDEPILVKVVEPVYPRMAKAAGLEDDIVLTFIVGKDGLTKDIKVISTKYEVFAESAKQAVSHYEYIPAQCNGRAFETRLSTIIEFRLTQSDKAAFKLTKAKSSKDIIKWDIQ